MPLQILNFEALWNPSDEDYQLRKDRYELFGSEVIKVISDSWRSIHVLLSNMWSLRSALGKRYRVKKYNNGAKFTQSMEVLYERVRAKDIRVVVIDAVSWLIEVSQSINELW